MDELEREWMKHALLVFLAGSVIGTLVAVLVACLFGAW